MEIDAALARVAADEMASQRLTTPRLAALAGMPVSTAYAVLSGRQSIGAAQIHAISQALGVKLSEFCARAEDLMD